MYQETFINIPLWQFEKLGRQAIIKHFVSGREGGVSEGEIGSLNLSFSVNDSPENVQENRWRLATAMGIAPTQLFFPRQTHSNNVKLVDVDTRPDDLQDTDALITQTPGLCIAVMAADCVPVLLYDRVKHAAAAVHAGWRGTVSKILTHTVQAMQAQFGTNPADLIAGIGPSICPEVYEVGEEVIAAAENAFGRAEMLVKPAATPGKAYFDLWEANRLQLLALGVPDPAIEVAGICTYTQNDKFFSARKSGNKAGRFSAGILLL
jgi:YfiH family protein